MSVSVGKKKPRKGKTRLTGSGGTAHEAEGESPQLEVGEVGHDLLEGNLVGDRVAAVLFDTAHGVSLLFGSEESRLVGEVDDEEDREDAERDRDDAEEEEHPLPSVEAGAAGEKRESLRVVLVSARDQDRSGLPREQTHVTDDLGESRDNHRGEIEPSEAAGLLVATVPGGDEAGGRSAGVSNLPRSADSTPEYVLGASREESCFEETEQGTANSELEKNGDLALGPNLSLRQPTHLFPRLEERHANHDSTPDRIARVSGHVRSIPDAQRASGTRASPDAKETHHKMTIVDSWFRHPTLRMIKLDGNSKTTVCGKRQGWAEDRGGENQAGLTVRNEEDESDNRVALADRKLQVDSHARKASTARERGRSAQGRLSPPRKRQRVGEPLGPL